MVNHTTRILSDSLDNVCTCTVTVLYHIRYINSDIFHHFLLMAMSYFYPYSVPYLIPRLYQSTTFSFLSLVPLSLCCIWLPICLIWSRPHFQQHSPWYSFLVSFSGRARQVEATAMYNYLEALGTPQYNQLPYFNTLICLGFLIGFIRPTASWLWVTRLVHSSWFSHSPWYIR